MLRIEILAALIAMLVLGLFLLPLRTIALIGCVGRHRPRTIMDSDPRLYTGHGGIAFNAHGPIFGFTPYAPQLTLEYLFSHGARGTAKLLTNSVVGGTPAAFRRHNIFAPLNVLEMVASLFCTTDDTLCDTVVLSRLIARKQRHAHSHF